MECICVTVIITVGEQEQFMIMSLDEPRTSLRKLKSLRDLFLCMPVLLLCLYGCLIQYPIGSFQVLHPLLCFCQLPLKMAQYFGFLYVKKEGLMRTQLEIDIEPALVIHKHSARAKTSWHQRC